MADTWTLEEDFRGVLFESTADKAVVWAEEQARGVYLEWMTFNDRAEIV